MHTNSMMRTITGIRCVPYAYVWYTVQSISAAAFRDANKTPDNRKGWDFGNQYKTAATLV